MGIGPAFIRQAADRDELFRLGIEINSPHYRGSAHSETPTQVRLIIPL